jgi:hypothetical protein
VLRERLNAIGVTQLDAAAQWPETPRRCRSTRRRSTRAAGRRRPIRCWRSSSSAIAIARASLRSWLHGVRVASRWPTALARATLAAARRSSRAQGIW